MANRKLDMKSKLLYSLLKMGIPHFKCPHCNMKGITLGQKFLNRKRRETRCHLCYEKVAVSPITTLLNIFGAVVFAYLSFRFIYLEYESRSKYIILLIFLYLLMSILVSIIIPVKKGTEPRS